jgi:cell wall-associated NlpC family hydrolase
LHRPRARKPRAGIVAALVVLCLFSGAGCKRRVMLAPWSSSASAAEISDYAIQVGVFASEDNAARLTQRLEGLGLDARVIAHESGYFKVQVGSFATRAEAERAARGFLRDGAVDEYFVVARRAAPAPSAASPSGDTAEALRRGLVETARSFLDFPYAWGGASAEDGFDCSGLTMAVFRLNGLALPRSLAEQIKLGRPVDRSGLERGDLVFFATMTPGAMSHVGIYIGDGMFIHAPGRNKKVRVESLSGLYFSSRFIAARRYF